MADEGDRELTQDEIWDDSALIDSWNQALEEYKKYHSIHANKGLAAAAPAPAPAPEAGGVPESKKTEPDAKTETDKAAAPTIPGRILHRETFGQPGKKVEGGAASTGAELGGPRPGLVNPPPVAVLGSVEDEGLKNLLMSWYYAGYYTGLYEGQKGSQSQ